MMMMIGFVLGYRYEDTLRDLMGRWKILKKRSALGLFIYTFALGIMIWAAVEANTNPEDYDAFIIKRGYFNTIIGIIIGIGFSPVILMILALAIFYLFPMDSFECYSRFDHPRSLQTLIQK